MKRRSFTYSLKNMKPIIFILFSILFQHTIAQNNVHHGPVNYCCDENNNFLSNVTCIDGKKINIKKCNETFNLYANEGFTIVIEKNGNLSIDDEHLGKNQYCYVRENGTMEEIYIICVDQITDESEAAITTVKTSLTFISVVFITITVIIYLMLPEMQDQQGIIIMHSISGLAIAFTIVGTLQYLVNVSVVSCHLMAYSLYFSFLYAFFWLNILCFHIWRQVVNVSILKKIECWRRIYYLYGIGGPALCLILVMTFNHANIPYLEAIHPRIGSTKCWFPTSRETFIFFYGPIAVLICCNIIYFLWTVIALWKEWSRSQKTKVLNYRMKLYAKLFFIMGITWMFEVISAAKENDKTFAKYIWIICDALNALEGVIIFLIMVVFRKKVIRGLANRKCCGSYRFPAKWRHEHDSECDPIEEEEITMTIA